MRSSLNLLMLVSAGMLSLNGCASSPPLVQAAPCPVLPSPPPALLVPPEVPRARQLLMTPSLDMPAPAKPTQPVS